MPALASRAITRLEGFLLEPLPQEAANANGNGSIRETPESPAPRPPVVLCTSVGPAGGAAALGAAVGVALARSEAAAGAALLVDLDNDSRAPGPTVLASEPAARLEDAIRVAHPDLSPAARGHICSLVLPGNPSGLESLARLLEAELDAAAIVVHLPRALWAPALADPRLHVSGGLLRAELPADRPLVALAVGELRERGLRARVAKSPLGLIASRRSLAGIDIGGAASRRVGRLAHGLAGERAQALPLVLGAVAVLLVTALVLAAIGGAVTGKGRVQRAADLAALSGARSMRDDFERLFEPAVLPNGVPNPHHLSKGAYLARASASARIAARMNGVDPGRLRVAFPDAASFAPVRIRADVTAELDRRALPGGAASTRRPKRIPVAAHGVAEVAPPTAFNGMPSTASGGGYSGSLAYRQGKPMRPDVARAFDRLAGAARRAGISLTITSAYRSDAEQARLFAQHPDPRWVAPPGHSLHRCATELDLGPSSAYRWLARNARRFGFLKRYAWEPWHFGYTQGPAPCSAAGNSIGRGSDGRASSGGGLPGFVPPRFRAPILRAASRWNVSAGMLAAQLLAESNFNPYAVSPAGARGIAQFMPGTARAYGLHDPFDAPAAINAQAHLMSDLLRQFHSIPLALAAYNAGSGAVAACRCIPFAETRAYVARILGLLDGAGELLAPPLEVRLVS